MLFKVLAKTTFWFTILHLQLLFLLQIRSMQGIECKFCNSAKMESWCGFSFHRLHRNFDQSQQTLECGHHPTSWESRAGPQDADIMHSTPRFLGRWSQTSRLRYSNTSTKGLDSESFYKLAWLTWDEINNSTNAVHCCKGMILFCCKVLLNKKNQQFSLTQFFALRFCKSLNIRFIMIVACTCSIMWSCSLGMPQSILASPQAKASFIVYVFPFYKWMYYQI